MLHLVHAAVSGIGWCISEAHTVLQPGAPCSPALTLCGEASAPSAVQAGGTAPWRGGCFSLFPTKGAPYCCLGCGRASGGSRSQDRRCHPRLQSRSIPSCCRLCPPDLRRVTLPALLSPGTCPGTRGGAGQMKPGGMRRQAGRLKVFPEPGPPPWVSVCRHRYGKWGHELPAKRESQIHAASGEME